MTPNWVDYELNDVRLALRPAALARPEARKLFDQSMSTRHARTESLRRLVASTGVDLGRTGADVQALNDWFASHVEADSETPGALSTLWQSVTYDIALHLGDVMIERHPNLHWEFFIWGKRAVPYQRPVIMGMSTEDPKMHTNIDVIRLVHQYAMRILAATGSIPLLGGVEVRGVTIDVDAIEASHRKEPEPDYFVSLLQMAARRA